MQGRRGGNSSFPSCIEGLALLAVRDGAYNSLFLGQSTNLSCVLFSSSDAVFTPYGSAS